KQSCGSRGAPDVKVSRPPGATSAKKHKLEIARGIPPSVPWSSSPRKKMKIPRGSGAQAPGSPTRVSRGGVEVPSPAFRLWFLQGRVRRVLRAQPRPAALLEFLKGLQEFFN